LPLIIAYIDKRDEIAYLYLTHLLSFEAIVFVYKALLAIALDDDKRRSYFIFNLAMKLKFLTIPIKSPIPIKKYLPLSLKDMFI
jgi:hypothetical protein